MALVPFADRGDLFAADAEDFAGTVPERKNG
jgi:hypothetical protein